MDRTESLLTAPAMESPATDPTLRGDTASPEAPTATGTDPAARTGEPPEPPRREPRWPRPALVALLLATGLLYLWGLGASGWANSFYSAAVQAGSVSWKAFFYGSSDAANSITVDKTPASLWLMALSVRVFGLNSWSILVPQALLGVASVGVLYATVRRWYGPAAGLIAGAVLAVTPVATLMFRFNNPDALLVFLLVAAAYATVRAVERAGTRWIVLAGALVGFGFLTKMLQAFLVVGGRRGAGTGRCPPLHRWVAGQQHPRADPRLQRPRPDHRRRGGQRRRRRSVLRPDRLVADVSSVAAGSGPTAAAPPPRRSPPGSPRTSPPGPSTASPSTT